VYTGTGGPSIGTGSTYHGVLLVQTQADGTLLMQSVARGVFWTDRAATSHLTLANSTMSGQETCPGARSVSFAYTATPTRLTLNEPTVAPLPDGGTTAATRETVYALLPP
jgi:hypothetical protein